MRQGLRFLLIVATMLPCSATHSEQPLGRLFFTPSQRAALDAGKQIGKPRTARPVTSRRPRAVTLNGVVTRSDGESAVWINGHETRGKSVSGVSASTLATDPTSAQVRVRGTRKIVRLQVGQQLNPVSGKVIETYQSTVPGAAEEIRSPKKAVSRSSKNLAPEIGPPAADRPDKTDAADADEPSNE